MCAWIVPPMPGLIEPAMAPEFFVDGHGAVERVGRDCARFYLCVKQLSLDDSGVRQHIVVAKIVRPITGMHQTINHLAQCIASERAPGIIRWKPRLMR